VPPRLEVRGVLAIKTEREPGQAEEELHATRLARFLLPERLAVPAVWEHAAGRLVRKYISGEPLDPTSPSQVEAALQYLASMHSIPVPEQLAGFLRHHGYASCDALSLLARLPEEREAARSAFAGEEAVLQPFLGLLTLAAEHLELDQPACLGHGDFQRGNLLISDGTVVPLDWRGFGLCDRSYEVLHFAYSVGGGRPASEVVERYSRLSGVPAPRLMHRGLMLDGLIRAGRIVRRIQRGLLGPDAQTREQFLAQVQRAHDALLHIVAYHRWLAREQPRGDDWTDWFSAATDALG
jgi:aminoglycoside phosphotransferase (APT) family kinase protein